jgi:hypothetical protein
MRKNPRQVDSLVLIAALVGALLIPLLAAPGLPVTLGTQQQIVRAVEMSHAFQAGNLYPRWAPDFNYGYGSPIWNYLAPLPHWLVGLQHVLLQSSPVTSLKSVTALALALGSLGAFAFARRRWGTPAGVLAASGFLLNPQMIWDLPLIEGKLGVIIALSAFVGALWGYERVLVSGSGRDLARAAGLTALIWLAHTPLNAILIALLVGWIGWVVGLKIIAGAALRQALAALLLGTLASAFYLVPAWWERDFVHWQPAVVWPSANWHAISPATLLALPPRVDLSAVNPPSTAALGVAVWTLALLSVLLALIWDWRHARFEYRPVSRGEAFQARLVATARSLPAAHTEMLYFALAALVTGVGATGVASPLWTRVPAWLEFYPRDLVAVCAVLCVLVIAPIGWILDRARRAVATVALALCAGALVAGVFPLLVTLPWSQARSVSTVVDIVHDELRGYMAASLTDGWLLPKGTPTLPAPASPLISSYQLGYVDNIARERLPAAAQVDVIGHSPFAERLAVTARRPFMLVLQILHFPGWKARLNDQSLPVGADPTGFLTISIPEGIHNLQVRFGGTRARDAGTSLSALSLLLIGALLLKRSETPPATSGTETASRPREGTRPDAHCGIPVLGLVAILAFVALASALPRVWPDLVARRSPPGVVQSAIQLPRAFQGGVDLLAIDIPRTDRLAPGTEVPIHLYWRATRPDLPDYQAELSIVALDPPGTVLVRATRRNPGGVPTSRWPRWPLLRTYIRDSYYLRIPADAPPGEYFLAVRLGPCNTASIAPCQTLNPLFVHDGRGTRMGGNQAVLPHVFRIGSPGADP